MYNMCQVDHLTGKEKETNCADLYYVMWEWNQHSQSPTVTSVTSHKYYSLILRRLKTEPNRANQSEPLHNKDLRIYVCNSFILSEKRQQI